MRVIAWLLIWLSGLLAVVTLVAPVLQPAGFVAAAAGGWLGIGLLFLVRRRPPPVVPAGGYPPLGRPVPPMPEPPPSPSSGGPWPGPPKPWPMPEPSRIEPVPGIPFDARSGSHWVPVRRGLALPRPPLPPPPLSWRCRLGWHQRAELPVSVEASRTLGNALKLFALSGWDPPWSLDRTLPGRPQNRGCLGCSWRSLGADRVLLAFAHRVRDAHRAGALLPGAPLWVGLKIGPLGGPPKVHRRPAASSTADS